MELEAQLDAFRQQQSEADRGDAPEAEPGFGTWVGGRKRRKKDDAGKAGKAGLGVKVRKTGAAMKGEEKTEKLVKDVGKLVKDAGAPLEKKKSNPVELKKEVPKPPMTSAAGLLGLVAYGSDDDD